jgi:hypothetical protein
MIKATLAWLWWFFCAPRPAPPPEPTTSDDWVTRLAALYTIDPSILARANMLDAQRTVAWAQEVERFDDAPIPDNTSKTTKAWLLALDGIEVGVIATVGSTAIAGHFGGAYVPALPPCDCDDFPAFRAKNWFARRAVRDEMQQRALALAAKRTTQKDGDAAKSSGPKKNTEEAARIAELQATLAENSARGPK